MPPLGVPRILGRGRCAGVDPAPLEGRWEPRIGITLPRHPSRQGPRPCGLAMNPLSSGRDRLMNAGAAATRREPVGRAVEPGPPPLMSATVVEIKRQRRPGSASCVGRSRRRRSARYLWAVLRTLATFGALAGLALAGCGATQPPSGPTPPTPGPTAAATPTPTATATPSLGQTPTVASPTLCGAPPNPDGYNFCGRGGLVYLPAANVCRYFDCIRNFSKGTGYMVECRDVVYSMSGGRSGVCASRGGQWRAVNAGP